MTTTRTPSVPGTTLLRHELDELLAALDSAHTIDAEDDALEELAGWADSRLGQGWEALYVGVALVGVAGRWMGQRITTERV